MKLLRDRLDGAVTRAEREWDLTPPAEENGNHVGNEVNFVTSPRFADGAALARRMMTRGGWRSPSSRKAGGLL
jgi:hypothetical protein